MPVKIRQQFNIPGEKVFLSLKPPFYPSPLLAESIVATFVLSKMQEAENAK